MTFRNPMFPPVDATRRRFLSNAAAMATAGAAAALTASVGPANAATASVSLKASGAALGAPVDTFLTETREKIDGILNVWMNVNAECNIRDRAVLEGERRNPLPDFRLPGDEGYSHTYRSDWHDRRLVAMRQAKLGPVKGRRKELAAAYTAAVKELADHDAVNLAELMCKADAAAIVDSADGMIARSVVWDLVDLRMSGDFCYQARVL